MLPENRRLKLITAKALANQALTGPEALYLTSSQVAFWDLLHGAHNITNRFLKGKFHLCSIINAKSGRCSEDCKFCAQSAHHHTGVKTYPLVGLAAIKKAYSSAAGTGADGFSIVTSGNELSGAEVEYLSGAVGRLPRKRNAPYLCLSIGRLAGPDIARLKKAGVSKFHHNLETSRRFFPKICSTHSYDERIATIRALQKAGIKVCSGGIFGLGETWTDRIDLARTLKVLKVDSIPLNFLLPVPGTSLEKARRLSPKEALTTIALFRYILPDTDIRICAGREKTLRDLQALIFYAGATGMMIGGYLTQPGREVSDDLQMLSDLGIKNKAPRLPSGQCC
ncbi:MAG: biotin synthase BioB [Planctomycetes bacterium]|nr:biotin synthase BioB [Planctomycetota bacterium]